MRWLIRTRPGLRMVQEAITDEKLGICVRIGNDGLRQAINAVQARLQTRGMLPELVRKWLQA